MTAIEAILFTIFTASIIPGWMLWMCRRSLFPRCNQVPKKLPNIKIRLCSRDGLEGRNSKEAAFSHELAESLRSLRVSEGNTFSPTLAMNLKQRTVEDLVIVIVFITLIAAYVKAYL